MLPRQFITDRRFDRDRPLHGGPGHHPRVVRVEIREGAWRGFERIEKPPIEPEQMNVGDRIFLAERPSCAQAPVGDAIDDLRMIEPALPRRMQRRGDEGHPGDRLCLGLDIAKRQQPRVREAPREIE